MGRRNLSQERTEQLLDAFEICISEYGLGGATLQRTAEKAELNIGMIYHYIGNRDDLLRLSVERLAEQAKQDMAAFVAAVPTEKRLPLLLQDFFKDAAESSDRILSELLVASSHNPLAKQLCQDINRVYASLLAEELARSHPQLPAKTCQQLAFNVLSLAYGCGLLIDLGFDKQQREVALQAAEALIQVASEQDS